MKEWTIKINHAKVRKWVRSAVVSRVGGRARPLASARWFEPCVIFKHTKPETKHSFVYAALCLTRLFELLPLVQNRDLWDLRLSFIARKLGSELIAPWTANFHRPGTIVTVPFSGRIFDDCTDSNWNCNIQNSVNPRVKKLLLILPKNT